MPNSLEEVADRVWVGSYDGTRTTVIAGTAGLVVVDPAGPALAHDLADELPGMMADSVVAVALTHGHPAHAAGLGALRERWPDLVVHAHEEAGVAGAQTFSSVSFVDLGDRLVELLHPGRGHSAADAVVRVADADVVIAGDLLGGDGVPRYGAECWPLEWPAAFDVLIGLLTPQTVVVPGHGRLLGKDEAEDQRGDVAVVAQTISDAASPGATVDGVLAGNAWPFPVDRLRLAVARALEQLPRTARQLPLV